MSRGKRLRGLVLRVVQNRALAIVVGAVVASPALMLLVNDYSWETGVTDGLVLVALASGVALVWAGISGRKPDWYQD